MSEMMLLPSIEIIQMILLRWLALKHPSYIISYKAIILKTDSIFIRACSYMESVFLFLPFFSVAIY